MEKLKRHIQIDKWSTHFTIKVIADNWKEFNVDNPNPLRVYTASSASYMNKVVSDMHSIYGKLPVYTTNKA